MRRVILVSILFGLLSFKTEGQIRFYLDYTSVPFQEGFQNNFKVLTGFKFDPNKEILVGLGLRGRFSAQDLDGNLRFSQSDFSLGFNYYFSRRFYLNTDVSFSFLNKVLDDVTGNPLDLDSQYYLNYNINATFVILRRLHFATGTSLANFSDLIFDVGDSILELNPSQLSVIFSLRLYLFQIKT